jgi:kynurenine formamidase
MSIETVRALAAEVSNWGRWGKQDQLGCLNLITDEHRAAASALVRRGRVFSLGLPLKTGIGPQSGLLGRFNALHLVTHGGGAGGLFDPGSGSHYTDSVLVMPVQGSTQWDALCHMYYDDHTYNAGPADVVGVHGAARGGIEVAGSDMVGRGVLLDVARALGTECLDDGYLVTESDLLHAEHVSGTAVREGDILLIRTGAMQRVHGDDWSDFRQPGAGLHWETARWLHQRGVAAVAADNVQVEGPSPFADVAAPFHLLALRDMGLYLGELWHLDDLAADCAADGVYEFLLVAPPLNIVGGTGSPLNPIAIK